MAWPGLSGRAVGKLSRCLLRLGGRRGAARWGKEAGQRGRRRQSRSGSVSGVGAGPDGSATGASGGGSSFSLSVGTLDLPGAPPFLCGKFVGWIEVVACQRGKLRLPKQCHPVPDSPSVRFDEEGSGWWNEGVLSQLSRMVVQ
uniref:Uncharacterized protein n=1 Tax=Oryza glumipatula TaxID=40148 RepID=A0A0D9YZN9_9ORYZ